MIIRKQCFAATLTTLLLAVLLVGSPTAANAQELQAFQFMDGEGKTRKWKHVLKAAREADVIFLGEIHNNPISHWVALELAEALAAKGSPLVLGMEMFERDQQAVIDAYFANQLEQETFEDSLKLWPNYETDYRPLVELVRQRGFPLVATNVPRTYAKRTFMTGIQSLEQLPEEEKALMAPLPININYDLPSYVEMQNMLASHGAEPDSASAAQFVQAQAIKDATMAHSIAENLPGKGKFLHINGVFHTKHREGIVLYLQRLRPSLKILVISTLEMPEAPLDELPEEHEGLGDFILAVPQDMTKTY